MRLAVLFAGNGFHSKEWWAKGEGKQMELGQVLAPLADFREKLLFIRGLYNEQALKGNIHSSQTGNLLSGAPLASGGEIRSGTSIDQLLAADATAARPRCRAWCWAARSRTRRSTRTTRCSTARTSRGLRRRRPRRWSCIRRWPSTGCSRTKSQRGDKSVLDAVLADASDLRRQISTADQRKLDEYLDSVRDVEQRIEQAGKQGELQGWRPTLDKPNIPRPPEGIPQNIADHMRLMCDILVLGFQTDTTRITTLKLNNDHSSLRFPHLGVDYMIHHLLSHSDTADWLKVNQFFVEQLAYIARKLDAIQEGERTALDNSMLLFCSSMLTGSHDATQLPVVLLGRGGGKIQDRPRARLPRQAEPPDVPAVPVDDGQDGRAASTSSATPPSRWLRSRRRFAKAAVRVYGGTTPFVGAADMVAAGRAAWILSAAAFRRPSRRDRRTPP